MNLKQCPRCRAFHPENIACPVRAQNTRTAAAIPKPSKKAGCFIVCLFLLFFVPFVLAILALITGAGITVRQHWKNLKMQEQHYPHRLTAFETAMDEQIGRAVGPLNFYVSCREPGARCFSAEPLTRERFLQDARKGREKIVQETQIIGDRYAIAPQDRSRYLDWFHRVYEPGWTDETEKPLPDSNVPVAERLRQLSQRPEPPAPPEPREPAEDFSAARPPTQTSVQPDVSGGRVPPGVDAPSFLTPQADAAKQ